MRAKAVVNTAPSTATRRSQAIDIESDAPATAPLIAAMVGLGMLCRIHDDSCMRFRPSYDSTSVWRPLAWRSAGLGALGGARSAPAENARSPAPVSTTTGTDESSATSPKLAASIESSSPVSEFMRSGRFMVTVATPSDVRSTRMGVVTECSLR